VKNKRNTGAIPQSATLPTGRQACSTDNAQCPQKGETEK